MKSFQKHVFPNYMKYILKTVLFVIYNDVILKFKLFHKTICLSSITQIKQNNEIHFVCATVRNHMV